MAEQINDLISNNSNNDPCYDPRDDHHRSAAFDNVLKQLLQLRDAKDDETSRKRFNSVLSELLNRRAEEVASKATESMQREMIRLQQES